MQSEVGRPGALRFHFGLWPVGPGDRQTGRELLDDPGVNREALARDLKDLEITNRWLGGWQALRRELESITLRHELREEISVLDLGSGGGDMAARIAMWSRRRGIRIRLVCLDRHRMVLRLARSRNGGDKALSFVVGDGRRLPLADSSVDIAFCSTTLHHFDGNAAEAVLREMSRVAREAVVATDLRRGWLPYWGAIVLLQILGLSPVARHDGSLSIARSFTPNELRRIGKDAGLRALRVRRYFGHRIGLRGRPTS